MDEVNICGFERNFEGYFFDLTFFGEFGNQPFIISTLLKIPIQRDALPIGLQLIPISKLFIKLPLPSILQPSLPRHPFL